VRTALTERLAIDAPIIQGSLGPWTSVPLTAAACEAGALGTLGTALRSDDQVRDDIQRVRSLTDRPFAVNHTLRPFSEEAWAATLEEQPPVISLALGDPRRLVREAHDAGCLFVHQVHTVEQARAALDAGVDVVVAQGTESGGFGGWVAALPLVPQVVDLAGATPVAAAGGIADGRGLAAALALGADGVLLGTRFLASRESPLHPNFKQAIVDSDGHDTLLSEIPDIAAGVVWSGAMSRSRRNRFIERWAGREWALRQGRAEALAGVQAARKSGDAEEAVLSMGQDAGLIHDIAPAAEIVTRIARDAERILRERLPALVKH
jgi:enoyl-[acyl-carrier protein] reductase II